MALTHFCFGRADAAMHGSTTQAMIAGTFSSEGIAVSGSNQQTTATAPTGGGIKICRVATDTACYVAFGANPDATTAGTRAYLPANAIEYFVVNAGDEGACVTA